MKKIISTAMVLLCAIIVNAQKQVSATSPDGQTKVTVTLADRIYYDVESHGETLFKQCHIGMTLSDRTLGEKPLLKGKKLTTVKQTITPIHPLKSSKVENNYTLLTLTMGGNYSVEWRVYNDGVAYRFVTALKGDIEVMSEDGTWQLATPCKLVLQQPGGFKTSCEESYSVVPSDQWKSSDRMSELPILVMGEKQKVLISEFDLFDYPGTFLKGQSSTVNGQWSMVNAFSIIQPKAPLEYEDSGDRSQKILKEADYVAKTAGTRSFPWRYMYITQSDAQLPLNTMPERLAPANAIGDPNWIKVGQTCWDWLNGIPFGPDVTFKSGINLDTYKYFVDFAARNGVGYMLMDEGWALDTRDPFHTNPEVHLPELIAYAQSKGVGIIVWLPWLTVEHHMDLFEKFEQWGIKGVKIDFMDRQDQWMVNFYERVAKEAAKHHIFIDFHGAFHPSGLDYKYPNVLTYEGVRGMEFNGACKPDNSIWLPFIRNAVGPMDYTPGSMLNYQPEVHHGNRPICAGVGTKAFNMAVFVLFESNLQMLMDNPCRYDQWPDCRDFLTSVPVNWDETRVLAAEAGQYCVTAKRKGNRWFIGGITNSKERDLQIKLDFLPAGKEYSMTSFQDGINAHIIAMDYRRQESKVGNATTLPIHMARNGGWCASIDMGK
ncbi:MAG: glycoside hydrolase family 97 protein [Bacteroidaceae bacterium]|nr:glycoside hydrolase family 97 protein [Bacteroidaceae bacterium]